MKDQVTEMLKALENNGQIAFVTQAVSVINILRNNAERLFLLMDIKGEDYIRRFDAGKKVVMAGDLYACFGKCTTDHPYYIVWENAQNFTVEAWDYAIYKTNELKFKSIFLIGNDADSLFSIPVFVKNRIQFFGFDGEGIYSFREELYKYFTLVRSTSYSSKLSMGELSRHWVRPTWTEQRSIEILSNYSEKLGRKLSSAFFCKLFKLATIIEQDAEKWHGNIKFSIRNAQRILNVLLSEPRTFTEFETIFHSEYTNALCCEVNSDELDKYKKDEKVVSNMKTLYDLYRESYSETEFVIEMLEKRYYDVKDSNKLDNQEGENNMKIIGVYSNEKKGRTTIKFDNGRVVSVQCDEEDKFDVHKGIAMALAKAAFGSKVLQECLSSYSKQKTGKENKKAKKARKAKAKAKKEESSQSSKKKDSGKNGHAALVDRYRTLKEEEK